MAPLLSGQARIVLRYSLISVTILSISALTLLLCAMTPQYCIVTSGPYSVMSNSFLITGLYMISI